MLGLAIVTSLTWASHGPVPASRPALLAQHAVCPHCAPSFSMTVAVEKPTDELKMPASAVAPVPEESKGPDPVTDALAGLTVAFSLLSKAIAASAIAGVTSPLVGIWSSTIMGITSPLLGCRNGVINGAAAVVVVPLGAVVAQHGVQYVPLVILASAAFQLLFGVLKLAKYTSVISNSVISGFLNGLGLLLAVSQLKVFTKAPSLFAAVVVAATTAAVTEILPKFTKAVPSSLVALGVASGLIPLLSMFGHPLKTLGSTCDPAVFAGGFSSLPTLIDLNSLAALATSPAALKIALPVAASIAFISVLETLLSAKVVDDVEGMDSDFDEATLERKAWQQVFKSDSVLSSIFEMTDATKRDAKAAEIFSRIDVDGSGAIDADELKVALLDMGLSLTDEQVAELVNEADVDRNGEVDLEEFQGLVSSQVTGKKVDVPSRSVIATAVGCAISGLLGGFGGCGVIPQTVLNMKSGGGGKLSSIVYGTAMAAFVLVFAPLVAQITTASLAGLMLTVSLATLQIDFTKSTFKKAFKALTGRGKVEKGEAPVIDLATLGLTTWLCYAVDMGTGIVLGVVFEKALRALKGVLKKA